MSHPSTLNEIKKRLWGRIATPPSRRHEFTRKGLLAGYWLVLFQERVNDTVFAKITCPWIEKTLEGYTASSPLQLWLMFIDFVKGMGLDDTMLDNIEKSRAKYMKVINEGLCNLSKEIPHLTKEQKIMGEWFTAIEQYRFASQSSKYLNELLSVGRTDVTHMAEHIWNMTMANRSYEERLYVKQNTFLHYENTVKDEMIRRMTSALNIIV